MGTTPSTQKQLQRLNREIEEALGKERKYLRRVIKLLLLGTAECGKSTILKQMRILHTNGFSNEEYERQKFTIFANIITGIITILNAMIELNIKFDDSDAEECSITVRKYAENRQPGDASPSTDVFKALGQLWTNKGVQQCCERSNEYQQSIAIEYFMAELERISADFYRPSEQDIIMVRVATTGVVQLQFEQKGIIFSVVDVGGQRSERKKWIHCFDDVESIIFMIAASEYDQKLLEDNSTNRLHESLALYSSILNCRFFKDTNFILFFNKKDLFEQKIQKTSIISAFPEYKGPQAYEESLTYIEAAFYNLNTMEDRTVYVHRTCSTDTNQVQIVLDNCLDTIREKVMKSTGIEC